jgi:hypothetical protein
MKEHFELDGFAPTEIESNTPRRVSKTSLELAIYIADMLRSIKTCANAPDLKNLQSLIDAAEREARLVIDDNPVLNVVPNRQRVDPRRWRGTRDN